MNTLNKNIAITALLSTSFFFSGVAMAAEGVSSDTATGSDEININEDDEITLSFNQPQSLAVSAPNNEVNRASGGIITKTWHVVSNNAVGVRFTGKSPSAVGVATAVPTFYKAEVDASGTKIANADASGYNYDHLVTTYGLSIAGQGSVAGTKDNYNLTTTEGVDIPTGIPANLVKALDGANGPDAHFGSIMPSDDGRFTMTLSAKGVGDVATTQSGDYQVTIVASFIAEEKGNNTITADITATSTDSGLLTAIDTYAAITSDTDDNSLWQDTTATGVVVDTTGTTVSTTTGGVELSPEVLSDDTTGTDDTAAANATEY
jgi:hypothetical protein